MKKLKKFQSTWRKIFHDIFPFLSDLIEENVKDRCVFPLVILGIYIVLVFIIINSLSTTDNKPANIITKLDFSFNYYFSQSFDNIFPGSRVKVLTDSGSAATQQQINYTITDLVFDKDIPSFTCDNEDRTLIAGTLHYFRMAQVCKIVKNSDDAQTDEIGYAAFSQILFQRGPQGNYQYQYNATNGSGISQPQMLYISSEALKLEVINNSYPPIEQKIGVPFTIQPIVKVTDYYGNPLQNKYIIAVSWPEPFVPLTTATSAYQAAYLDAIKFAYLSGDVSEPSNSSGIAKFNNLTVIGSTYNYTYIILVCENSAKTLWSYAKPAFIEEMGYPFYVKPIKLLTSVISLGFIRNMSSRITEGVVFGNNLTPIIQANSTTGPQAGKLVFVLVSNFNGKGYPKRYKNVRKGYKAKQILYPIPGKYNENSDNPLSFSDPVIPILTDSRGYAFFNSSSFSRYGPAGYYKVEFICDGVSLETQYFNVLTAVRKISFLNQPPRFFSTGSGNILSDFIPIIRITDGSDNPIMGKTPEVSIINSASLTLLNQETEFGFKLYTDNSLFSYSDVDGLLKLYFLFTFATQELTFFKIQVQLEGYSVVSREVKFRYSSEEEGVGYFKLIQVTPNKNIFSFGDEVTFKFQAFSNSLDPLENATIIFDLHSISEDVTKIPEMIIPYFKTNAKTDSDGFATISNINFDNGISSLYFIRPILIYPLVDNLSNLNLSSTYINIIDMIEDPDLRYGLTLDDYDLFVDGILSLGDQNIINYCFGDMLNFTLLSQIGSLLLLNDTQSNRYKINNYFYFRVRVYNTKNIPLNQSAVNLDFNLIHFPSYLMSDYLYKNNSDFKKHIITFSQLSKTTDQNGEILMKLLINANYFGFYAVTFGAQGCVTEPLEMLTEFSAAYLQIIEQPTFNYTLKNPSDSNEMRYVYSRSGDFLPRFKVKVTDSGGLGLINYPIIVRVMETSNNNSAILDFPEIYGDSGEITFMGLSLAFSNYMGEASFYRVSTYDIQGNFACVKFQFFCGDVMNFNPKFYNVKMEISSNKTNQFCFYDDSSIQITNSSYSKMISGDSEFGDPVKADYHRPYITDMDIFGMSHLFLTPFEISNKRIDSRANLYTSNDICLFTMSKNKQFYNLSNTFIIGREILSAPYSLYGGCDITIPDLKYFSIIAKNRAIDLILLEYNDILNSTLKMKINESRSNNNVSKNQSYIASFTFTAFKWSGNSRKNNFKLAAHTILNTLFNNSLNTDDKIQALEQTSIKDLYNFVKNATNIPEGVGLSTANLQLTNILEETKTGVVSNATSILNKITSITTYFASVIALKSTFSILLNANSKCGLTQKIYVSSDTTALEIYIDIPSIVTVGYIFQVAVISKKGTNSVVKKKMITASITASIDITKTLNQNQIEDVVTQLATGKLDSASIAAMISSQSNVQLDPSGISKKTNDFGIAYFNLMILQGKNSTYKLSFSAEGASPKKTSSFTLINPINRIDFFQDLNQTIEATIDAVNVQAITLSVQPILMIKYSDGQQTIKNKLITVRIYKNIDDDVSAALEKTLSSYSNSNINNNSNENTKSNVIQTFDSLLYDYNKNNSNMTNVLGTLSNMWNIVSNAGKLKSEISKTYENIDLSFTVPNETTDSHFVFTDLQISFNDYGKYRLIFLIDGLESPLSQIVEIKPVEWKVHQENTYYTVTYVILIITALIVLCSNVDMYSFPFNINAGLFLVLVIVIVAVLQSLIAVTGILIYVICGLLLLITFNIFFGYIQKFRKKKNNLFASVKNSVFAEYTYQRMHNKPSQSWIESIDNKTKINSKNNIKPLSLEKLKHISSNLMKNNTKKETTSPIELCSPMNQLYSPSPLGTKNNQNKDKNEFMSLHPQNNDFVSKKLFQKIKEILTPFYSYQYKLNIGMYQPVFFPQRLMTALLCALASTIFMAYTAFSSIIAFEDMVYNMNFKVYEFYLEFMNKGFNFIKNSGIDVSVNENDFNRFLSIINFVREQFIDLSRAFAISFIIGTTLASIYLIVSYVEVLIDFKRRVLLLRKGVYSFNIERIEGIKGALEYVGLHISNTIISFLIVLVIIGLTTFPFFWPLFWIMIYNNLPGILFLVGSGLIVAILQMIALRFIIRPDYVYNRRLFAIYEFIQIYLNIAGGVVMGVVRFITGIIVSTITFNIISEPLLPYWVARTLHNDVVHNSYCSLIYLHHFYNNPTFITVSKILIDTIDQPKQKNKYTEIEESPLTKHSSSKAKKFRNKLFVALLLEKNPELKKFRKSYLEGKKIEEKGGFKKVKEEKFSPIAKEGKIIDIKLEEIKFNKASPGLESYVEPKVESKNPFTQTISKK